MDTLTYVNELIIPAALALLPAKMNSTGARAMLLATGLQESRFEKRRQMGGGPARGFHEFEEGTRESRGGCTGVLLHPASKPYIEEILRSMGYDLSPRTSHVAIEHNDVLDIVYARLLLWTSPRGLPISSDTKGAWTMYLETWNPGDAKPETWPALYAQAWEIVGPQ